MGIATWRTVKADDTAPILQAAITAAEGLGESISGIGDAAKQFGADKTKIETDAFIADLMAAGSLPERDAMLAAADQSFLNMGRASERAYELGADERDLTKVLAEEARDLTKVLEEEKRAKKLEQEIHDRDVKYEDIINTREIKEAEDLIEFEMEEQYELEDYLQKNRRIINNIEFNRSKLLLDKEHTIKLEAEQAAHIQKMAEEKQKYEAELEVLKQEKIAENAAKAAKLRIEKEHAANMKKLENEHKQAMKKIENEEKSKSKILADKLEIGTGIEKILNEADPTGDIDTDFESASREAFAEVKGTVTDGTGITSEQFDDWTGDNVSWNDSQWLAPLIGYSNSFKFTFRGQRFEFGKGGWLENVSGGIIGGSGTTEGDINALKAAILSSDLDEAVRQEASSNYTEQMKALDKPVRPAEFNSLWAEYITSKTPGESATGTYERLDKDEFLIFAGLSGSGKNSIAPIE